MFVFLTVWGLETQLPFGCPRKRPSFFEWNLKKKLENWKRSMELDLGLKWKRLWVNMYVDTAFRSLVQAQPSWSKQIFVLDYGYTMYVYIYIYNISIYDEDDSSCCIGLSLCLWSSCRQVAWVSSHWWWYQPSWYVEQVCRLSAVLTNRWLQVTYCITRKLS